MAGMFSTSEPMVSKIQRGPHAKIAKAQRAADMANPNSTVNLQDAGSGESAGSRFCGAAFRALSRIRIGDPGFRFASPQAISGGSFRAGTVM